MLNTYNYIPPCCTEFQLDFDSTFLVSSMQDCELQDYNVDNFDFDSMEFGQE